MTQTTRKTVGLKARIKRRHFLALLAGTVYVAPCLFTINEAQAGYRSRPSRPSRPSRRSRPSYPSRPSRRSHPSRPSRPSRPPQHW